MYPSLLVALRRHGQDRGRMMPLSTLSATVASPKRVKLKSNEPLAQCFHSSLGPVVDEQLVHDASHVCLDCLAAEVQVVANLPVRATGGYQPQHVHLTRRQQGDCRFSL